MYIKVNYPRLFEELFDMVSDDGIYLCEDLHTSYWDIYGGGYKNKNSFIEYSKNFIDYLNAFYSKTDELKPNYITQSVKAVTYYDSMIFLEKRRKVSNTISYISNTESN